MTDEEYNSRITVMGIHQIARRASLPLETFILAALILKRLESVSEKFYDDWLYESEKPECGKMTDAKKSLFSQQLYPSCYVTN